MFYLLCSQKKHSSLLIPHSSLFLLLATCYYQKAKLGVFSEETKFFFKNSDKNCASNACMRRYKCAVPVR